MPVDGGQPPWPQKLLVLWDGRLKLGEEPYGVGHMRGWECTWLAAREWLWHVGGGGYCATFRAHLPSSLSRSPSSLSRVSEPNSVGSRSSWLPATLRAGGSVFGVFQWKGKGRRSVA